MIQKLLFLIIFLTISVFSQNNIFTQIYFDNDTDLQTSYKYYFGYSNEIQDNLQLSISGGFRNYSMVNVNNIYRDLRFGVIYSPNNDIKIIGNTSFLFSKQWNPIFIDGLLTYFPTELLYFELYFERESVGSALTNSQKLISTFTGISVDINVTDKITFVIGFANNNIAENNRMYQNYRAVYTLPIDWIFIDLKLKIMNHGDYSPYYFSPNNFGEYNIGTGISTKLFTYQYYMRFYIGGGVQTVNDDTKGFFTSNIKLSGDFTPNLSGKLSFGISNSISDSYGNYLYNYGKIEVNYAF